MKTYLFLMIVILLAAAAVPVPPAASQGFVNQILRPCVSGAAPFAKVEANPGGVAGNVAVTTCTGGQLLLNGSPLSPGSGTVTSVGLGLPASVFSVSGSPVTTTGTLTGAFVNQSANTVFAGPTSGAAAAPAFRAIVAADLPVASLGSDGIVNQVAQNFAGDKSFFGNTTLRQGNTIWRGNVDTYMFFDFSVTGNVRMAANQLYTFSNTNGNAAATGDTGIERVSAGVVGINNGTAGTFTNLRANATQVTIVAVAALPACNAGAAGTMSAVNDALAPAFLTAVAGGGAVVTPVFCDGTNWIAY